MRYVAGPSKPSRDCRGEAVRLLCDEMLKGIGRWLRAAGYDTAIAKSGVSDDDLLAQAHAEDRVLLTCDRRLAGRGAPGAVVLLDSASLDEAARALREGLGIDWLQEPFSRCLLDNAVLEAATPGVLARLPERTRQGAGPITVCPDCGRVYWPGSHVRRMRARLGRWRQAV
jgi:uncharacterized protein with PIN domain